VVFTGSTAAGLLAAEVDGSGTTYTVSVTGMASSGTVVASIVAGGALDPAGNGNVASASSDNSVAFDLTAPTVTINQAAGQNDPVSTGPIEFTVVFSDDVTGFIGADISFAGSTAPGPLVADVTGSGTTYTVSVTGMAGSGIVVASVVAGAAMDAAGNFNLPSTSTDNSITYDVTAPTVTINRTVGQNDPTNSTTIHFTVVFGEPVTGFSSGDVSLAGSTAAGAAVDSVSGSGTSYTISVKGMTSNGTVAASIVAGAAQDAAGNANLASNTSSVLFDMLAPTVTINRAADQADPAMASAIRFTVVFSEAVNGFTGADVVLGGSAGASTATVGSASPDGTTYTVTVSGMTRPGTVMAQVSGGAAMDLAGNLGQASTSTDNLVVNGAILALGTDKGAATGPESTVRIIDSLTGSLLFTFVPYAGFRGGVRVALADFNHDGIPDLVTAPGNGLAGGALIHIFDGAALLQGTPTALGPGVRPFGTKYTKELFIATGRMNSSTAPDDQVPDLVVGNFQAGPRVRVLNGQDALAGTQNTLGNLNPFGNLYKGGARVAVGDVNGDGRPDVLVGQSANGSTVKVFSGEDFKTVLTSFKAGTAFKGGVFLAAGDVDGDLGTDIIVGFGSGTAAKVQVWEDQSPVNTRATRLTAADLPAVYPAPFKGGVRVAAFDLDGDGDAEVLAAPGPGAERRVRGLDGLPLAVVDEIFSAPADFAQGLFLAGARLQ
jgi:hypothetical protein